MLLMSVVAIRFKLAFERMDFLQEELPTAKTVAEDLFEICDVTEIDIKKVLNTFYLSCNEQSKICNESKLDIDKILKGFRSSSNGGQS
jgi:hypothetical protein